MDKPVLRKRAFLVMLALLALLTLTIIVPVLAQNEGDSELDSQFAGRPQNHIPEFPPTLQWINVDAPLTMESLQGKIVLFDFWTYGCINCIHMIPVLRQIEEKYPEEVVVIGVHSAKFENEGVTENLRQIVQRYELHHPVINDNTFHVWQTFGAQAWPTLAVADPRGNLLARQSGEIPFEALDDFLRDMIAYWDSIGELDRTPIELALEGAGMPTGALAFPGKVLADVPGNRLFIADSNHHRLIIADLTTYEVLDVIGSGQRGFENGGFDEASFDQPQGMALKGELLYVADVNNHAIRVVDLAAQEVDVVAGTGIMGRGSIRPGNQLEQPLNEDLRSPWDVEFGEDGLLYIAMAGTHQIWQIDLEKQILEVAVGNGREAAKNDTLDNSELAQPSGLYFIDGKLYFADSESSTIRVADFNEDSVALVSGTDANNLFDFGDVDGELGTSRLQHALGVVGGPDGLIYVADTYNSKIKIVDEDNVTTTIFGLTGNGGFVDGGPDVAQLDEPGGLDYAELPDGRRVLFIADTNNHAIRVIDLDANVMETIAFPNPEALQIAEQLTVVGGNSANDDLVSLDSQSLMAGDGEIVLVFTMPDGYKINDLAPSAVEWSVSGDGISLADDTQEVTIEELELRVPVTLAEGEGTLHGEVTLFYCEAINESLCFIDEFSVEAPVSVDAAGENSAITVERTIVVPDLTGAGSID